MRNTFEESFWETISNQYNPGKRVSEEGWLHFRNRMISINQSFKQFYISCERTLGPKEIKTYHLDDYLLSDAANALKVHEDLEKLINQKLKALYSSLILAKKDDLAEELKKAIFLSGIYSFDYLANKKFYEVIEESEILTLDQSSVDDLKRIFPDFEKIKVSINDKSEYKGSEEEKKNAFYETFLNLFIENNDIFYFEYNGKAYQFNKNKLYLNEKIEKEEGFFKPLKNILRNEEIEKIESNVKNIIEELEQIENSIINWAPLKKNIPDIVKNNQDYINLNKKTDVLLSEIKEKFKNEIISKKMDDFVQMILQQLLEIIVLLSSDLSSTFQIIDADFVNFFIDYKAINKLQSDYKPSSKIDTMIRFNEGQTIDNVKSVKFFIDSLYNSIKDYIKDKRTGENLIDKYAKEYKSHSLLYTNLKAEKIRELQETNFETINLIQLCIFEALSEMRIKIENSDLDPKFIEIEKKAILNRINFLRGNTIRLEKLKSNLIGNLNKLFVDAKEIKEENFRSKVTRTKRLSKTFDE